MIEIIKSAYWSKADAYIMPLTGLPENSRIERNSYLFWNNYSIEDYKFIIVYTYDDAEDFQKFCLEEVFPILDKKGYLEASYDIPASSETKKRTIFILDIAEWAKDIEMFLAGKYSKLGFVVKELIQKYHVFDKTKTPIHIYVTLFPNKELSLLSTEKNKEMDALHYAAENYGFDIDVLKEKGEIGTIYTKEHETLYVNTDDICQNDIIVLKGTDID